jgi:uncharacterized protein YkwD
MTIILLGIVAVLASATITALALCRAAAAGDRTITRAPSGSGSVVSPNRLVLALGVTAMLVMASPAQAAVHRLAKQHVTGRDITSSCPDAGLRPNGSDLGRIRAATLCLVNRERLEQGDRPLAPNERLEHAAQAHTESMAFGNYFEHVGPRGDTVLSRVRASGYMYSSRLTYEVGENIGWGTLWEATPDSIVAAWMASPGHRANILDGHFRATAIGVSPHPPSSLAHGQAGAVYTQDFGNQ